MPDIVPVSGPGTAVPVAFEHFPTPIYRTEIAELLPVPARQLGGPSAFCDHRPLISDSRSLSRALLFSMQPALIRIGAITGAGLRKGGAATIGIRQTTDSPALLLFRKRLHAGYVPPLARSSLGQAPFTVYNAPCSPGPVRGSWLEKWRERLLSARPLPFPKSRLPGERLQCTSLALQSSDDAAPLGLRWQKKKGLWDRGARWKKPSGIGALPLCDLSLCH